MPPMPGPVDPKSVKLQQDAADLIQRMIGYQGDLNKKTAKTAELWKEIDKRIEDSRDDVDNLKDDTDKLGDELAEMRKKGLIDDKKMHQYNKQLKKIWTQANKLRRMKDPLIKKESMNLLKDSVKDIRKDFGRIKLPKEMGSFFSAERITKFSKELSRAPDILSVMGTVGKASFGLFGKMLGRGGPVIAATAAVVEAVWKIGNAADSFVKDANKAFATVRGPDIMTDNVKKQFKDFNDQIYKTGENWRVGLNVTQIREFMSSLAASGVIVTDLNRGFTSYRDAIYIAAKASKSLGVEMAYVGSMMSKMLLDFRMDLTKIDKTFNMIAFDAKKAGLQTDRFWQVIQNANASLALYGVAINAASKTMKRFSEDQVGGTEDAAEATQNMFDMFKQGSIGSRAAIIDLAKQGGAKVNKYFTDAIEELNKEAGELSKRVGRLQRKGPARTSAETEELVKLRKQLLNVESKERRFRKMVGANSVEQVTEMGALAKESPAIMMDLMRGMIGLKDGQSLANISSQDQLVLLQAMTARGASEKTVKMLLEEANITKGITDKLVQNLSLITTIAKDNKDILSVAGETGDNQIDSINRIVKALEGKLGPDLARELAYVASTSEEAGKIIAGGNAKEIAKLLKSDKTESALSGKRFKGQEITEGDTAEAAKKTLDAVVNQTLSFEEMQKIAADEVKWRANSLGVLQAMNKGVFDIFKFLIHSDREYVTGLEKQAQQDALQNETLKGLLQVNEKGLVTTESQHAAVRTLSARMQGQKNIIEKNKKILEEAKKVDSTYTKEDIEKAQKAIDVAEDELKKEQEAYTVLTSLNETNAKAAKFQELLVLSNTDAQQYLADETVKALESTNPNKALEDLKEVTGLSWGDMADAVDKVEASAKGTEKEASYSKAYDKLAKKSKEELKMAEGYSGTAGYGTVSVGRQVAREPMEYRSPTTLKVHEGETLVPKGYFSGAGPLPVGPRAPLGQPPAGAGNRIEINVNATTNDLAQLIGKEVNKALYNWQLNGMAKA